MNPRKAAAPSSLNPGTRAPSHDATFLIIAIYIMGRKKPAPPPPRPKSQGTTRKRTPTSNFDPAAGEDIYEPEKIVGQRMAKGGVMQYEVKWVGWESKHNTYEPRPPSTHWLGNISAPRPGGSRQAAVEADSDEESDADEAAAPETQNATADSSDDDLALHMLDMDDHEGGTAYGEARPRSGKHDA